MKDKETVWQEMLSILEVEINALSFDVWVKKLRPLKVEDNILVLTAPTPEHKTEVMQRYLPLIRGAMRKVSQSPVEVIILAEDEIGEVEQNSDVKPSANESVEAKEQPVLNPKYNFENFVVGGCNRFAYAAARAVADNPGTVYNPLFIYGGVGLGKTHIMQAIGNAVRMSMSNLKVLYVSSETFLNEFVESIQKDKGVKNQAFREKYRGVDLLMLDDVQFMSGKEKMQEEIFNTFEALQNAGKQMVFASDRPPQDIRDLDARVRSRFSSSLVVDIQPPDLETRIAILQKKSQDAKVNIAIAQLEYIAERVSSNIREMEGVLTKVIFLSRLHERKVDFEICREALNDYRVQECDEITADEIIECTCRYFNIQKADIVGKRKNKEIVEPRQISMYLINELMNIPLTAIGAFFGREYTTVMHARDKVSALVVSDTKVRTAVNDIKALVLRK